MCGLVCRLVRSWKQTEANVIISQAAVTSKSSLLLHDLNVPELNVTSGSYATSPYENVSRGFAQDCHKNESVESNAESSNVNGLIHSSLFCKGACSEDAGRSDQKSYEDFDREQILWFNNNRHAALITPRVSSIKFLYKDSQVL